MPNMLGPGACSGADEDCPKCWRSSYAIQSMPRSTGIIERAEGGEGWKRMKQGFSGGREGGRERETGGSR